MGLETGEYITDLVITNPLGTDPKSEGDDHFRLVKKCLSQSFPNISGAVNWMMADFNNFKPTTGGTIDGAITVNGIITSPNAPVFGTITSDTRLNVKSNTAFALKADNDSGGTGYVGVTQGSATAGIQISNIAGSSIVTFNHDRTSTFDGNVSLPSSSSIQLARGLFDLKHDGATAIINNLIGDMVYQEFVNSGNIIFQSYDNAGAIKSGVIIGGSVPDVQSFYDGFLASKTVSGGIALGASSNLFASHNGVDSVIRSTAGDIEISNEVNSGFVTLDSKNSSGVTRDCIKSGGANASTIIYHDGVIRISTKSNTVNVGTLPLGAGGLVAGDLYRDSLSPSQVNIVE